MLITHEHNPAAAADLDWINFATASVENWASWEGKDILVDGKISGKEVQIPQNEIIEIKLISKFRIRKPDKVSFVQNISCILPLLSISRCY